MAFVLLYLYIIQIHKCHKEGETQLLTYLKNYSSVFIVLKYILINNKQKSKSKEED